MQHSYENILFVLSGMICAMLSGSCLYLLIVWLVVSGLIVGFHQVRLIGFLKHVGIPFSFILFSALSIVFDFTHAGLVDSNYHIDLFGLIVSYSKESIRMASLVSCKSLCLVTFVYYLILTSPIHHLFAWMSRYKLTKIFGEMMLLTYRQIFMIKDVAADIARAQRSRLGYGSRRETRRNLTQLLTSTFVLSLQKTDVQFRAMEARCYDGDVVFLQEEHSWDKTRLCWVALAVVLQVSGIVLVYLFKIV